MNPVVGLDVSSGKSEVQAFLDKGNPYGKSFTVLHTNESFTILLSFLIKVEDESGIRPSVILEATGHYHTPVIQFLEEYNYQYIMLNPLLSYQAKKSTLRKVKTDAVDAYCLCELYYKEELVPHKKRGNQLLNLRNLTRQHETLTDLYVQAKLQFHAVLEQVFPEYKGVFGDLYCKVSLYTLMEFQTSESVFES
jgi:transposase